MTFTTENVPTRSMWGPFSTEFQFQAVSDCQLVQPSWCLLVMTTYLRIINNDNDIIYNHFYLGLLSCMIQPCSAYTVLWLQHVLNTQLYFLMHIRASCSGRTGPTCIHFTKAKRSRGGGEAFCHFTACFKCIIIMRGIIMFTKKGETHNNW